MKKRHLFMSFVAALALASCSSDDNLGLEKGPNSGNGENSYIAVNIVAPRDLGSRADDGGFEIGLDGENEAKTGVFLFYDAAGNPTQTPQTVELDWTEETSTGPQVEKISEAVVVIAGNTAPTQVLVILNAPSTARLENQTISQVKALVGDYSNSEDGKFMMTNAVYVDGDKEVCATDITNKTYKTEAEAQKNPQDIYVERILAKVRTSATPKDFAKGAEIEINGSKYTLTQEIGGIEIANIAKSSYLFKSISGWDSWQNDFTSWNDAPNKRCYWATSPTALEYGNESWNGITTTPSTAQTFYVQENTTTQRTSVLITATLKDDAGKPISFVRWAGKYYFKNDTKVGNGEDAKTVDGFLKQYAEIVKNAGYRLKNEKSNGDFEFVTIGKEYFEWLTMDEHKAAVDGKTLEQYEMTAKVVKPENTTWTVVKLDGTFNGDKPNYVESSLEEINNALFKKVNRVWLWEDGKCYYFKEIEHLNGTVLDPAAIKVGQLGVVRNHIYDLALNSLNGVGVPVYNPDETIIPQKPSEDLFYLAARINILKWKVVKQTVNFE